jgi:hypothetical protein
MPGSLQDLKSIVGSNHVVTDSDVLMKAMGGQT